MFALTESGQVWIWRIIESGLEREPGQDILEKTQAKGDLDPEPVQIDELTGIVEMASGTDHFIALDDQGKVWAMGDDTFG